MLMTDYNSYPKPIMLLHSTEINKIVIFNCMKIINTHIYRGTRSDKAEIRLGIIFTCYKTTLSIISISYDLSTCFY